MPAVRGIVALAVLACLDAPVSGAPPPAQHSPAPNNRLSLVRSVRALTPGQANLGLPVQLRGVVTTLSGWRNSFFLQDASSGISVDRLDRTPDLKAGEEVIVDGITAPGSFAPIVLSRSIRILGRGALPPAKLDTAAELLGGAEDSQWLSVRGNIREAQVKQIWGHSVLALTLDIGAGVIVDTRVQQFAPGAAQGLVGAGVLVQGVGGTIFNDRHQFVGLRLFVPSLSNVHIEKPLPADPFTIPQRPLGGLLMFSDSMKAAGPVKVAGVVTWSGAREGFYLQSGEDAVFVENSQSVEPSVGSRVQVVGYPTPRRGVPTLHASFVRTIESDLQVHASLHPAAEMITLQDGFISTPYDARLVTIQGRLVSITSTSSTNALVLQDGRQVFRAILPASFPAPALDEGSTIQVTGICNVSLNEVREASGFEILVRTPADLVVLKQPPWWNARHALQLSALLSALLAGFAVSALISRRRAEVRALIVTDELTSLYNRRGFELLVQKQREIARRRRTTMLLFYFDVNRFKQINDTFGHRQGDQALQQVASALQEAFRVSDVIARLGGDEFAVLAIDAAEKSEPLLLTRLSNELKKVRQGQRLFELSVSAGVVVCGHDDSHRTLDDLLEIADASMYTRKRQRTEQGVHHPLPLHDSSATA